MNERFVFNNLIYKLGDEDILLINLISFRRQKINKNELDFLLSTERKLKEALILTTTEKKIYEELLDNKQILDKNIIDELDSRLKEGAALNFEKIPVKSVMFNLSYKCNFNCEYCYQRKYKFLNHCKSNITTKEIEEIKIFLQNEIFDVNFEKITISGGEPLLKQNIDVINYILKVFDAKKFNMFTNGENIIEFKNDIDFNRFYKFQISLDGHDDIIKSVNKREGKIFEKVIEGIKYLASLNKEINISVMWTKTLESKFSEFIGILKKSNIINKDNIRMKFALTKSFNNEDDLDKEFYDLDYIKKIRGKYNPILREINSEIEILTNAAKLSAIIHRPVNKKENIKIRNCNSNETAVMTFSPDGGVYWCTYLGNDSNRIGSYGKNAYVDVNKILEFGNRTIFKIEKCKNCNLRYICGAGCPLPLIGQDKDIMNPVCGIFGNEYFWENLEDFV